MKSLILLSFLSTSAFSATMSSDYQKAVLEAIDNVKKATPAKAESDVQKAILDACGFWK